MSGGLFALQHFGVLLLDGVGINVEEEAPLLRSNGRRSARSGAGGRRRDSWWDGDGRRR